jgi:predicted nucleic acid-binding protein
MRVMLDTNVFDRLERDDEAISELENRRDLRLIVSEIQLRQLSAIPDEERRARYLDLASRLCATVSAAAIKQGLIVPALDQRVLDRHEPDRLIAAAALARCDLLVTDDKGLLEYAGAAGVRAVDWKHFVDHIVFKR